MLTKTCYFYPSCAKWG